MQFDAIQSDRIVRSLAGSVLALACGLASAAIVTTPAGVVDGPHNDALAPDVWQRIDIRASASVGITDDYPRNGNGSVLMTLGNDAGKTTWQYFPTGGLGLLSSFTSATYDWYRDAVSTTADHFHPVFRIRVDTDGDPATTGDQSWLVYERGAIDSSIAADTDTWVTETIDDSTPMWVWQAGAANNQLPNTTMAQFKAGSFAGESGGFPIPADSKILGIQVGAGSGWSGTFRGAVDNIGVVAEVNLGPDNFELPPPPAVAPVPMLDWLGLTALAGLLGGLGLWRQRRRGA